MKCPGQDSRYWESDAIFEVTCPNCGHVDEFFKDETSRKCKKCGHRIINPKTDFGCAAYCKFAEQCIGDLPSEFLAKREDLLKERVAAEMKAYFGSDTKRINHAKKVARYAEIIAKELNANLPVVLAAAYLHDIGIKDAEKLYNSSEPKYQEELGPGVARTILLKVGAREELITEVCDIIGHHHHASENESDNFKSVYDADQIVYIEEEKINDSEESKAGIIEKIMLTDAGRELARKTLPEQMSANVN